MCSSVGIFRGPHFEISWMDMPGMLSLACVASMLPATMAQISVASCIAADISGPGDQSDGRVGVHDDYADGIISRVACNVKPISPAPVVPRMERSMYKTVNSKQSDSKHSIRIAQCTQALTPVHCAVLVMLGMFGLVCEHEDSGSYTQWRPGRLL
jgi:hypothetical protein